MEDENYVRGSWAAYMKSVLWCQIWTDILFNVFLWSLDSLLRYVGLDNVRNGLDHNEACIGFVIS